MNNKELIKEFIEKGANLEHDRWARWQKYMFSKFVECEENDKFVCLPVELFRRWSRQIETPYSELSEQEKESDRKETRNYVPLLEEALKSQKKDIVIRIKNIIEEDNFEQSGITLKERLLAIIKEDD